MRHPHHRHLPQIYLKPCELFLSRRPAFISTVLGSCVSVTVFSHASRLGGICHAMLPSGGLDEGFKFVDSTLDYMIGRIVRLGVDLSNCEVKLFGGADVLLPRESLGERLSVGTQNVLAARRCLDKYGMPPSVSDVGGIHGRKIYFDSQTGNVYLKKMRKTQP